MGTPNGQEPQAPDDLAAEVNQDTLSGTGAEGTDEPQYLTRADLEALEQRIVQQARRAARSAADSANSRLQNRIQAATETATRAADQAVAGGFIQASQRDAYLRHLRDSAVAEALGGAGPGVRAPAPPEAEDLDEEGLEDEQPEGFDQAAEQVQAQGEALARRLGLADGDPELAAVIPDGTAEEFFASIKAAARLKALRTQPAGGNGGNAPRRTPGRSPAVGAGSGRVPATNPIANIESTEDLWNLEWEKTKAQGH